MKIGKSQLACMHGMIYNVCNSYTFGGLEGGLATCPLKSN